MTEHVYRIATGPKVLREWLEYRRAIRAARRCPNFPDCDCDPRVPRRGQRVVVVHNVPPPVGFAPPPMGLMPGREDRERPARQCVARSA